MRVLIVCPQFAPNNTADSHRVRLILPYLREYGCEAEVLAVDPRDVRGPRDPWLAERLPNAVPVHHVRAWPLRGWGLNGLAQRAGVPLYRAGCRLLAAGGFDLVFFSTTRFHLHVLGPLWQRRYGVPFCMDYQDPWVNDYYRAHPDVIPPGGRVKYGVNDWLSRHEEARVASRCSGFLAVSQGYLEMLSTRYGQAVTWQPRLVQPFPGEPGEFQHLEAPKERTGARSPQVIRYIGRGGEDMLSAARGFFASWRALIDEKALPVDALQFEAIGTAYYAGAAAVQTFVPIAAEYGLDQQVSEQPLRLGYQAMLQHLAAADALVVFGSNDPAYTASKIYPYLLAQRPLLALFHGESSVVNVIADVGGGQCVTFDANGFNTAGVAQIRQFLLNLVRGQAGMPLDLVSFEKYGARCQAERLVSWFGVVAEAAARQTRQTR